MRKNNRICKVFYPGNFHRRPRRWWSPCQILLTRIVRFRLSAVSVFRTFGEKLSNYYYWGFPRPMLLSKVSTKHCIWVINTAIILTWTRPMETLCHLSWARGERIGLQGDALPRAQGYNGGAKSYRGRRIAAGASKSPNNATSTFFTSIHLLPKDLFRTWGRQTCFLPPAPSNLVTPLSWTSCNLLLKTCR